MSSTGAKLSDGRVNDRIQNYTKFWKPDPLKEGETDNTKRLDSYTEVVNGQFHLIFFLKPMSFLIFWCDGHVRVLWRRDWAVRVWLGTILSLLSFLQRRGFPCLASTSWALSCLANDPSSWYARPRCWMWCRRSCTWNRPVHRRTDRRIEQQRLSDWKSEEIR